jgi:hypothetical protein
MAAERSPTHNDELARRQAQCLAHILAIRNRTCREDACRE